jgi:SecD/SecF fusion protein
VLPDAAVETLNLEGEQAGFRFNIRTTEDDVQKVQSTVAEAFRDTLALIETTVGSPEPIPSDTTPPSRFAGGLRFPLSFNRPVDVETVQAQFSSILADAGETNPNSRFALTAVAEEGDSADGPTRMLLDTNLDEETAQKALTQLATELKTSPGLLFDRLENFGGAVAGEARLLAMVAVVLSWLIIIGYLWIRFKSVSYGLAAVLALVHDVLITLGAVALSPYKIDLPMIAAFLTLIGFSVNDTIVIFDRIREIKGKSPRLTPELVNAALNQTLSRTILTSLTSWLVVVIFYFFGGEGLRGFSFCLVVGFLSGTYSTIYIAAPILIDWTSGGGKSSRREKTVATTQQV